MDPQGNAQIIKGRCPLANLFGYASELRNLTQGRATFSMNFAHYETMPFSIAEEVIEKNREKKKRK